ncbi:carbonic anhydrase [Flexibacter flexilis DSM 6793]|uniref:Carbonic anhydrase 2 n=1 Tax=Flexibacter flexilis DSM 6793 TaxID=927664 RepID=A0A1I1M203_9BACT|nr:carbonate dehydratase [Flexibacter flexilis]SFC77228.1 carbonic anhydrase [Flexibacter flexilis DSM 6793]
MTDSSIIHQLLDNNKQWVEERLKTDPSYFEDLSQGQSPSILWIGCSDSRVPAESISGAEPGELFVHRNIANLVVNTDMNVLSVVDYAVRVLKVKHIIVCGHYQCGGVRAAMSNSTVGILDNWLSNIKEVYRLHDRELEAIEDENIRANRLSELNVLEQVYNLSKITSIQRAWQEGPSPVLHGWVYDLGNGLIKNLDFTLKSNNSLDDIYKFDFKAEEEKK